MTCHMLIAYDNDDTDHDAMVHKVLQRCKEVNLKLNKEKFHFRCTSIPFFGEEILRRGVQPDPQKNQSPHRHATAKQQNELQIFLGISNYLSKFSPGTTQVCDPLQKLTIK